MSQNNSSLIILCGLLFVVTLHMISTKNSKLSLSKWKNDNVQKNSLFDQIKVNIWNKNKDGQNTLNVGESNQVILHKYIFEKLQEIVNQYYGQKNLTCPYEIKEFSAYTLPKDVKEDVMNLLKPILTKLNENTSMHFKVTGLEKVTKKIAKHEPTCMYLIEVFIYDKENYFEKKLVVDLHLGSDGAVYHINSINYASNNYLCNEVYKGRNTSVDHVYRRNSNMVKKCEHSNQTGEDCASLHVPGKNATQLEYTVLNKLNHYNSYTEKSLEYNKKKLPLEMNGLVDTGMEAWPCGKVEYEWDEKGILKPKSCNTCEGDNACLGNYDSSYQGEPLTTYYHPSTFESRT
jgi:hypothetical protein